MATQTIKPDAAAPESPVAAVAPLFWRLALIAGAIAGFGWVAMALLSLQFQAAFYVIAIVPIAAGMYVGRKIQGRPLVHGMIVGATALLVATALITAVIFSYGSDNLQQVFNQSAESGDPVTVGGLISTIGFTLVVSLGLFSVYGVWLTFSSKQRTAGMREEIERRGGTLPRPGRVINLDDVQALPLPKFAAWVRQIFLNQKFAIDDYRIEKEKVDLHLRRTETDERWLVRCTVQESLKSGTVLAMDQELRTNTDFVKAVLANSMSIDAKARSTAKNKSNLEVLDGETLLEISH